MTQPPATELRAIASPWPALAALGIVALVAFGMLGIDFVVDNRTAKHTSMMVEDSMRSIAIADDLRYQAYRLSTPNLPADEIKSVAEQIDVDARAYEQLANGEGEAAEWARLQGLLAHLRHEQPLPQVGSSATLVSEIETSIARLVLINQNEARKTAAAIADVHHDGLVIDGAFGVMTLAAVALVAFVLLRTLRRQRELLHLHLATVDDRARELAAFAGRASHDLKGPLSPIRGYADLLSLNPAVEVREPAKRIARAVERMAVIIDDLLELSVHGKPAPGRAAVRTAVLEVLEELRNELRDADVDVGPGDFVTACSPNVLAQVLRNVITNAAKYRCSYRRLVLHVDAKRDGDRIAITIADNGIGMAPDVAAHAFDPLYRAPDASVPGHGIGLSIVRRTVEAIGGAVSLTSRPGEGTAVTIAVPAVGAT